LVKLGRKNALSVDIVVVVEMLQSVNNLI
jgi:hypothetical protein